MNKYASFNIIITLLCATNTFSQSLLNKDKTNDDRRMVCYYNAESALRLGFAEMQISDLDGALEVCSHLIYGYAGLKRETYEISSLNVDLDMFHFKEVTSLKSKHPKLKVFLSVGGDYDQDSVDSKKYIHFLEAGPKVQANFIQSSISLLQLNRFDGLDLAMQLPRNKPRKVHSQIGQWWKQVKKVFTGDFVVDPEADIHKNQYTDFVNNLSRAYRSANLGLSMTVLPHVNSTWYFNVPEIVESFDFINLLAFDFLTPERNPEEADYTGPIYFKEGDNRLPYYNIETQVNYWIGNQCPPRKLNLGIPTYGRAWEMTLDSGFSGVPVVKATRGPARKGLFSNKPGLLSWPEICSKVATNGEGPYRGSQAPLRKVSDLENLYGNYAFSPADDKDEHGLWISFDDPEFAVVKTLYAIGKDLGGIALFDLSYDDFRGLCTGVKFPILRNITENLILSL